MPTVDYYLSPIDIRDSHVLTAAVERMVNEPTIYEVPFAPLVTESSRRIRLRIKSVNGAGLASLKADNAETPIVSGSGDVTDLYMELPVIGEKEIIKESDLEHLQSPDPLVAKSAAQDILDKAVFLRKRNVNRTRWMAWQAAKDELVLAYPNGVAIQIDYDLDGNAQNSWFSTSHLVTTSVSWATVASADAIEDMFNWSKILADDLGCDQSEVIAYMRSSVFRLLKKNAGIKGELSPTQPRVITPKTSEIIEVLGIGEIRIRNDWYATQNAKTKNYYLDNAHILLTGPDRVNGDNIMEMKDGPVARVVDNAIVVGNNPGALSELYINEETVTQNVRVKTSRLPVMLYPAAFVYAQVII